MKKQSYTSTSLWLVAIFFFVVVVVGVGEQLLADEWIGLRPGTLQLVKQRLQQHPDELQQPVEALIARADLALELDPPTVTDKPSIPPSGDLHDYLSLAPYWWPDPQIADGLPFIRRDGEVNPQHRGESTDYERANRMSSAVQTLAFAFALTGREVYAQHAAKLLRGWFLDPATAMNPNLNYAQGVPGINTGRPAGIIESLGLVGALQASRLLQDSQHWSAADDEKLKQWMAAYLDWLLTSELGQREGNALNNHGSQYDVQVMQLALMLNRRALAKNVAEAAKKKRIAAQIFPDGRQPHELTRTKSLSYSRTNLNFLMTLATLAEHVEVDLWHFETDDGRSIQQAVEYLWPYVKQNAEPWPFQQLRVMKPSDFASILRQSAIVYREPKYHEFVEATNDFQHSLLQLYYPLPDDWAND